MPAPPTRPRPSRRSSEVGLLLASAIALVLILEGLLPFLNPGAWRRLFERAIQLSDAQIRMLGLTSLAIGVIVLLVFGP